MSMFFTCNSLLREEFDVDKCVICCEDNGEVLGPVKEKGTISLLDASSSRGCYGLLEYLLASPSQIFVHVSCRKRFTDACQLKKCRASRLEGSAQDQGNGEPSASSKKMHQTRAQVNELARQVKCLQFKNPGRFMEDFNPERSQREMRKVRRRCYKDVRRGNKSRIYDDHGVRLSDGNDLCDCLSDECLGCHFPCPRCASSKCGAECRGNRNWYYSEIETEGAPRRKVLADLPPSEYCQSVRQN